MKTLMISILITLGISTAMGSNENLKLNCKAKDGSTFLFDQFENSPCRIRHVKNGTEEEVTGVSSCIFPDEVHDSFSFWWIIPNRGKAELVGFLEPSGDRFYGRLGYRTASSVGLAYLECKILNNY